MTETEQESAEFLGLSVNQNTIEVSPFAGAKVLLRTGAEERYFTDVILCNTDIVWALLLIVQFYSPCYSEKYIALLLRISQLFPSVKCYGRLVMSQYYNIL